MKISCHCDWSMMDCAIDRYGGAVGLGDLTITSEGDGGDMGTYEGSNGGLFLLCKLEGNIALKRPINDNSKQHLFISNNRSSC